MSDGDPILACERMLERLRPLSEPHAATLERYFKVRRGDEISRISVRNSMVGPYDLAIFLQDKCRGISYEEATEEDLKLYREHLTAPKERGGQGNRRSTMVMKVVGVKNFYKWLRHGKDFSRRHWKDRHTLTPHEEMSWAKFNRKETSKKKEALKASIFPHSAAFACIEGCSHPRDKALLAGGLWDGGLRRKEVTVLKVKHYRTLIPRRSALLTFPGVDPERGTEDARDLTLTEGVLYMDQMMQVHPLRDYPEAPLYYALTGPGLPEIRRKVAEDRKARREAKARGVPPPPSIVTSEDLAAFALSEKTVENIVKKAMENANVGTKDSRSPHDWRHSSATHRAKVLKWPEMALRLWYGWVEDSDMPSHYVTMDDDATRSLAYEAAGITAQEAGELPAVYKPQKCARCSTVCAHDAIVCDVCGAILGQPPVLAAREQVEVLAANPALRDEFLHGLLTQYAAEKGLSLVPRKDGPGEA